MSESEGVVIAGTAVLYGLAFYNCYHILGARHSPAASISWLWAHMTLPLLAIPLYWVFGLGRLKGYRGYGSVDWQESSDASLQISENLAASEHYRNFSKIFSRFNPVFVPYIGTAELLVNGSQTFSAIFKAITEARAYILVQYYILRSDRLGLELKELLINRARQGVSVYLLYDSMGSFWLSRRYVRDLRRGGVKTATFLPVMSLKRFYLLNFRNHRKIIVVDGRQAFTGGLNVGEEYVGSRFGRKNFWRDTHVGVEGPAAKQLQAIFVGDWQYATGENLQPSLQEQTLRVAKLEAGTPQASPQAYDFSLVRVQVFPSGPYDEAHIGFLLFMQMIHSAKERLWVSTPYFVPDEALQRSLELAVLRGVDVRILIPRKAESLLVHWVTLSYAEQMQRKGVKILLYHKGFVHQKVVLLDHTVAFIGTSNFDNRTLYLNFELMLAIFGDNFNQKVAQMLLEDFAEASPFAPDKDRLIRKLIHLRANGARLLAPLL